jgi:hypothetical protein
MWSYYTALALAYCCALFLLCVMFVGMLLQAVATVKDPSSDFATCARNGSTLVRSQVSVCVHLYYITLSDYSAEQYHMCACNTRYRYCFTLTTLYNACYCNTC